MSENGPFVFFWDGPFSQWHPSPMTVAGVSYGCAEQFMMHAKALLFGDGQAAADHSVAPAPVQLHDLDRDILADELIYVMNGANRDLRAGHESRNADVHVQATLGAAQNMARDCQVLAIRLFEIVPDS